MNEIKDKLSILKNDKIKNIIIVILAFTSVLVFFTNLNSIDLETLTGTTRLVKFFEKCVKSFNGVNITSVPIFIALYYLYKKWYFDGKKICKTATVLSIFFALSIVFGYSYNSTNSWDLVFGSLFQLFKSILVIIGYYSLFYILIKKLYLWLDLYKTKVKKQNRILNFIFEKHSFIMPFVIIMLFWLPYIIFFYPGVAQADGIAELYNAFHIENYTLTRINLINENVYINQWHSVLHQLILGGFFKLGELIGGFSLGMFLYSITQAIIFALTLSYTIHLMKKIKSPMWLRILALLLYTLISYFPLFAITLTKDTYATIFTLLYLSMMFELIVDNDKMKSKKFSAMFIIVMILVMMSRNDGIYRVIISFVVLILLNKQCWKKLLLILAIPVFAFEIYNYSLPYFGISKGPISEMLKVPLQQTARVVSVYGEDAYEKEDIEILSKVLQYDTLKEDYDKDPREPGLLKEHFNNKGATASDVIEYLKVWFKYLFKYPTTYIEATLNGNYKWFYPDLNRDVGYTSLLDLSDDGYFNINFVDRYENLRETILQYHYAVKKLPVISKLYNLEFYVWALLIQTGYLIYSKKTKYLPALFVNFALLLILIASPANGNWRVGLPLIVCFALQTAIIMKAASDKTS